jgi:hypothetical protein
MKIVTNLHTQSLTLADGTVLGAASHTGSTKQVPDLSEEDARLVERGLISVNDAPLRAVSSKTNSAAAKEAQ